MTPKCKACVYEKEYSEPWKHGHQCWKDVQPSEAKSDDADEEVEHEHFFLAYKTLHMPKYEQKHDSSNKNYHWTDVDFVEKVYCAKCGLIKFTDSI